MKIGVVFPQTEIGNDPAIIRDFAQAVEGMGFNHLLVYDHGETGFFWTHDCTKSAERLLPDLLESLRK